MTSQVRRDGVGRTAPTSPTTTATPATATDVAARARRTGRTSSAADAVLSPQPAGSGPITPGSLRGLGVSQPESNPLARFEALSPAELRQLKAQVGQHLVEKLLPRLPNGDLKFPVIRENGSLVVDISDKFTQPAPNDFATLIEERASTGLRPLEAEELVAVREVTIDILVEGQPKFWVAALHPSDLPALAPMTTDHANDQDTVAAFLQANINKSPTAERVNDLANLLRQKHGVTLEFNNAAVRYRGVGGPRLDPEFKGDLTTTKGYDVHVKKGEKSSVFRLFLNPLNQAEEGTLMERLVKFFEGPIARFVNEQ